MKIKEILVEASLNSPKANDLFNHISHVVKNYNTLWNFYTDRYWARNRLNNYIGKRKVVDKFLASLWNKKEGEHKPVIAFGDASFNANNKNEISAPTTSLKKHCRRFYRTEFEDEYFTTRKCYCCGNFLKNLYRDKIIVDKVTKEQQVKKSEIRGLKWCSTSCRFIARDKNSCLNIAEIYLRYNDRPSYLSRTSGSVSSRTGCTLVKVR